MQIQLGVGEDSTGAIVTNRADIDHLNAVSMIEAGDWAVMLARPLTLHVGEQVWLEGEAVHVRRPDGTVTVHEGEGHWLCR